MTAGTAARIARVLLESAPVFVVLFLLAAALQFASGAYAAEFWGADEAAHFVTGRLFHDYAVQGFPAPPVSWAWDYYGHYPKVAIGHWPPVFYVVQGFWTLLWGVSRESVLLLQAALAATAGSLLAASLRRLWNWPAALLCAATFVLLPPVQFLTSVIMAEVLCTVAILAAALQYGRWLDQPGWRNSAFFAFLACCVALVKINGVALALVPPVAVLLTRNTGLVRRTHFWFPALVVGGVAGPWYLWSAKMASEGWRGSSAPSFLSRVARANLDAQIGVAGVWLFSLALLGLLLLVVLPAASGRRVDTLWAVLAAVWVAVFVFHTFVLPVRETRHMVLAAPSIVAFAFGGLFQLAEWWKRRLPTPRPLLAALCLGVSVASAFRIPQKMRYGAAEAVSEFEQRSALQNARTILVSSAYLGEGAFIAEMALRRGLTQQRIVRATKLLADVDWGGYHWRLRAETPAQVCDTLVRAGIDAVALDTRTVGESNPHHHVLLDKALRNECSPHFRPMSSEHVQYRIYTRASGDQAIP